MDSQDIQIEAVGSHVCLIRFRGYLGGKAGEAILAAGEAQLRAGRNLVVLQISDCPAIASPGIAFLIDLMMRVTDDFGGRLVFCGLEKSQIQLLTLVEILTEVPHASTREEALALIQRV